MAPLKVKVTKVYGKTTVYPICDSSKVFAKIAKTKTLTPETLACIRELGFMFEDVQPLNTFLLDGCK